MHTAARLAAPLALALVACAPACGQDAQERIGGAEEPGLSRGVNPKPLPSPYEVARAWLKEHPGACGVACFDAWAGTCSAVEWCKRNEAGHDDLITCGSNTYLTCDAARDAMGGAFENCRLFCEDLLHPSDD
jgi:hypothetical protein